MRLRAKVIVAMQQRPVTAWASTSTIGANFDTVLFKFVMNEDYHAVL
jgi:hypothetical protein